MSDSESEVREREDVCTPPKKLKSVKYKNRMEKGVYKWVQPKQERTNLCMIFTDKQLLKMGLYTGYFLLDLVGVVTALVAEAMLTSNGHTSTGKTRTYHIWSLQYPLEPTRIHSNPSTVLSSGSRIYTTTPNLNGYAMRPPFAIGGKRWRNLRVKLTPTFTSGKAEGYVPNIGRLWTDHGELYQRKI
ncbi:hypothetical protein NQ317_001367 [Molorchus minor]|uniref:Uncharacterized protein n=1 Tax=Molorchus minor TaxID=1323400 RepID=A0ABQ9J7J7_9CUCU|nr:hypothetical protein NQ317_001367 [Molorchus minor]